LLAAPPYPGMAPGIQNTFAQLSGLLIPSFGNSRFGKHEPEPAPNGQQRPCGKPSSSTTKLVAPPGQYIVPKVRGATNSSDCLLLDSTPRRLPPARAAAALSSAALIDTLIAVENIVVGNWSSGAVDLNANNELLSWMPKNALPGGHGFPLLKMPTDTILNVVYTRSKRLLKLVGDVSPSGCLEDHYVPGVGGKRPSWPLPCAARASRPHDAHLIALVPPPAAGGAKGFVHITFALPRGESAPGLQQLMKEVPKLKRFLTVMEPGALSHPAQRPPVPGQRDLPSDQRIRQVAQAQQSVKHGSSSRGQQQQQRATGAASSNRAPQGPRRLPPVDASRNPRKSMRLSNGERKNHAENGGSGSDDDFEITSSHNPRSPRSLRSSRRSSDESLQSYIPVSAWVIHIYIYRERDRQREMSVYMYRFIYTYIYIYIIYI